MMSAGMIEIQKVFSHKRAQNEKLEVRHQKSDMSKNETRRRAVLSPDV